MRKAKSFKPVNVPSIVCETCAGQMKVARIIPAAMVLPELHTFRCSDCGSLKTVQIQAEETKATA